MQERFKAYNGSEPYIFVSYAHADSSTVYPLITRLHSEGYRIWYDEGIPPTEAWRAVINEHIFKCAVFMVFVTGRSMQSREVIGECTFAINLNKKIHIVYLENVPNEYIDYGIIAHFVNNQRLMLGQCSAQEFERKLREPLGVCLGAAPQPANPNRLIINPSHLPPVGGSYNSAPADGSGNCNVVLTDPGASKLMTIKVIRELTGCGLAQANSIVASVPVVIKKGVSASDARSIVRQLEEVGAMAEVRQ